MAGIVSSEGELQVSKCHCETGRKRHRIPKSIQIPYETTYPAHIPTQAPDSDSDDGAGDGNDDGGGSGSDETEQNSELDILEDLQYLNGPEAAADGNAVVLDADDIEVDDEDELMDFEDLDAMDIEEILAAESAPEPDAGGASEDGGPPRVTIWRLNLTALSQIYNIYMVAYQDKIHISRPRSCVTNVLPAEPDLILQPPASEMSYGVGGYLDEAFPHQVNHLIVGELGCEEILLLAYDDGDVVGYYTRHIENEILRRERNERYTAGVLRPFFHENVGKSAWGLAVHKQSRIIGVSSNAHKVCVFVFALTGQTYRHNPAVDSVEFFRNIAKDEYGNVVDPEKTTSQATNNKKGVNDDSSESEDPKIANLEYAVRRRDANWRIVLETGRIGTNMPNIAFSENGEGHAEKVVAVDINGRLWLMDIWHFSRHPHIKIEAIHSGPRHSPLHGRLGPPHRPKGWGVLVLPESSFLPTKTHEESLGLPFSEAKCAVNDKVGRWIDISRGIEHVRNNSTVHPWMRSSNIERFAFNPMEPRRPQSGEWFDYAHSKTKWDHVNASSNPRPRSVLACRSSILRAYEVDIELRSFEEDGVGIMFEKAIDQTRPLHAVLPAMRISHERLANLIHVPELSLVVAGSLCGRVALLTLTQPEDRTRYNRAFRIEAILPTKADEDEQLRPICPMLGVAIAPVPFSGNVELADKPVGRRRYRLMLHFYDLRILSYELSRCSATDPLSIV
ncbi:hypothetical protein F5Y04DRAFT_244771 [Hypomontagnella monticulosa]|nr:hypothetical protein F5Y04DRAFT_244771 [Hypomontagnella monticulosa]